MSESKVIFKPYFVQVGRGPHIKESILSLDRNGDPFHSDVRYTDEGIIISDLEGKGEFALSVRWNVEGYGFLYMPLDNGGEFYRLPNQNRIEYNLNFELLKTRVARNQKRLLLFSGDGLNISHEAKHLMELGEQYFEDALASENNPEKCAKLSQIGLKYAIKASEYIETEKAKYDNQRNGARSDFLFGCDTRGYFQMEQELFFERFTELFNYGTITHYLKGDAVNFEEVEGQKQFAERDRLLDKLLEKGITVEGRPLYWVHQWVTPEWLKNKTYSELLKYVENHVREVVGHYGDRIKVWEVVNELHDWANENQLNHEQTIELTKLACDVARDTNPNVKLLINNCCPFADYMQKGMWHDKKAKFPQRTPHQFTQQLIDAGVDFDLIGVQVYFVHRTLTEAIQSIERYKVFDKKIQLAEVGAPSYGITQEFIADEKDFSQEPYEWHRHWDEELQADWLEKIFTYAYSQNFIEAANWYDFVDPYGFLKKGGILRSPKGEKKAAVDRLLKLQQSFKKQG